MFNSSIVQQFNSSIVQFVFKHFEPFQLFELLIIQLKGIFALKIVGMRFLVLIMVCFLGLNSYAQLDRKSIYSALASDSKELVQKQLDALENVKESSELKAFKGALQMKAAQFQKTAKAKMDLFNAGKKTLESEIKSNDGNVEYRFLRLLIQENAPKQLKYNGNIDEDVLAIMAGYSKLKESAKTALEAYAKKSSSLKGLL